MAALTMLRYPWEVHHLLRTKTVLVFFHARAQLLIRREPDAEQGETRVYSFLECTVMVG